MDNNVAKTIEGRVCGINRSVPPTPEMLVQIKESAALWQAQYEEQLREHKDHQGTDCEPCKVYVALVMPDILRGITGEVGR